MKPAHVRRIGVFGHYGNVNLGDEASFAATVQNIQRRLPDAVITGFTLYPGSTQERHGITTFPIRRTKRQYGWQRADARNEQITKAQGVSPLRVRLKETVRSIPPLYHSLRFVRNVIATIGNAIAELGFLWSSYRRLRRIDVLWIAGSNQIEDAHGAWGYPYTLYAWTWLCRLTGTKVLFVSVGASPMRTGTSRFFCRGALSRAIYRSFRSTNSRTVAMELGVKGEHKVYPDIAFSLETKVQPAGRTLTSQPLLIGINPMGYFDERYWPVPDPAVYQTYVRKLAQFTSGLLQSGYRVMFFPTQLASDPPVIDDVTATMEEIEVGSSLRLMRTEPVESCDELLSLIDRMDITIVTRFHGVILSQMMHKPVIAISYEQKIDAAMSVTGHSEYCLPIDSFTVGQLRETLERMVQHRANVAGEIAGRIAKFRQELAEQYDRLVRL